MILPNMSMLIFCATSIPPKYSGFVVLHHRANCLSVLNFMCGLSQNNSRSSLSARLLSIPRCTADRNSLISGRKSSGLNLISCDLTTGPVQTDSCLLSDSSLTKILEHFSHLGFIFLPAGLHRDPPFF